MRLKFIYNFHQFHWKTGLWSSLSHIRPEVELSQKHDIKLLRKKLFSTREITLIGEN